MFLIYPEGNFIEASRDEPFLQIGETKYGKPILVRALEYQMNFQQVVKLLLVSFDSTLRTNLSVGLPIDYCDFESNKLEIRKQLRIEKNNQYFAMLSDSWGESLKKAVAGLPNFEFKK